MRVFNLKGIDLETGGSLTIWTVRLASWSSSRPMRGCYRNKLRHTDKQKSKQNLCKWKVIPEEQLRRFASERHICRFATCTDTCAQTCASLTHKHTHIDIHPTYSWTPVCTQTDTRTHTHTWGNKESKHIIWLLQCRHLCLDSSARSVCISAFDFVFFVLFWYILTGYSSSGFCFLLWEP